MSESEKHQKTIETPALDGLPIDVGPSGGKKASEHLNIVAPVNRRCIYTIVSSAFLLFICALNFGCGIYVCITTNKSYSDSCRVYYNEGTISGQFEESIEIDTENSVYEKLHVPYVLDSSCSTIVHDFEKNLTAIVDKDRTYCFVMDLNRTVVQPPQSLYDALIKIKSGTFIPTGEVIREQYRVLGPKIKDIVLFGDFIYSECQYFNTYRLVRTDEPPAMNRKRSVNELHVRQVYNLGNTLGKYIHFVELSWF